MIVRRIQRLSMALCLCAYRLVSNRAQQCDNVILSFRLRSVIASSVIERVARLRSIFYLQRRTRETK